MRRRTVVLPVGPIVVVALAAAGCGGGGGGGSSSTSAAPAQTAASTTPAQGGASAGTAAGKQLFASNGCSSCHTLSAAGASGTVGPDLDKVLKGKSRAFIKQSIVQPNAVIAPGYSANIMPQNFGQSLSSTQIDQLVSFLSKSTGGG